MDLTKIINQLWYPHEDMGREVLKFGTLWNYRTEVQGQSREEILQSLLDCQNGKGMCVHCKKNRAMDARLRANAFAMAEEKRAKAQAFNEALEANRDFDKFTR